MPDDTSNVDPIDEDDWDYDDEPRRPSTAVLVGIGAVVVLAILAFIITRGDSGSDDASKTGTSKDGQTTTPKDKDWSGGVKGWPTALGPKGTKPTALAPTTKPGAYVWVDFDGWHLWVITGNGVGAVSGTITSNDKPTKAELVVPDTGTTSMKDYTITFQLKGDAKVTGFDFNPGFYGQRISLSLNTDKGPLDAKLIHLGAGGATPEFPIFFSKGG